MLSFEESQSALTDIADQLPPEILRELNGGILLLPETKQHPQSINGTLFILGQYHNEPRGFGRYVTIYYGSFCRVHGHLDDEKFTEQLKEVLYHELTHHLESLAGDRTLNVQDAVELAEYKRKYGGGDQNNNSPPR